MAEGVLKCDEISSNLSDSTLLECAICLQTCVHPAELPCGHIFCFLCIKGIAFQSGRCAMCRETIPLDFLYKPKLVVPIELENQDDAYQWYYEGYSGWWQYDQRASTEIEEAYQRGEKSCQLLLAGFLYVVDFNTMVQYRQTNPVRRRRIKRDVASTDKLGVAGLRPPEESESAPPAETERHPVHIAETLIRTMEEVEMGLQRLWLQTSDELVALEHQPDPEPSGSPRPPSDRWFSSSSRTLPSLVDQYGMESLGQEDYPEELGFRARISPNPRDGRCFNPRLELGDDGEDDSDDGEEIDEEPRRIFSGACDVSAATYRPRPMRASCPDTAAASVDSDDVSTANENTVA